MIKEFKSMDKRCIINKQAVEYFASDSNKVPNKTFVWETLMPPAATKSKYGKNL